MSQKWEKPCVYGLDILGDFEILFRINLPETTGLAKKFHLGFSIHLLKSTPLHVPAAALLCRWLHVHPFLLCVLWRGHWDWCITAGVNAAPRGQECRVSGNEATWALFIIEMSSPWPFWFQEPISWKTVFPRTAVCVVGDGLGMIQAPDIHCALGFYHYCISSTSDHQALDPRGWGPLV